MCGRASLEPRYDVILFENLRLHTNTMNQTSVHTNTMNLRFQKSPLWRAYLKTSVFWCRKTLVTCGR